MTSMKPILFNTEMVRAILDGRKTVTRRVIKPQPVEVITEEERIARALSGIDPYGFFTGTLDTELLKKSPYHPGDILYVRETFQQGDDGSYIYRAGHKFEARGGWKPSLHMPREAARLFLCVTNVRVERLQDITEEQAKVEGCKAYPNWEGSMVPAVVKFSDVWNSTIKPKDRNKFGWNANPWVLVITFKRVSKEEAQSKRGA